MTTLYRRKVDPVQAEQWWGRWSPDKGKNPVCTCTGQYHVHSGQSVIGIQSGDWIVTAPDRTRTVVRFEDFPTAYDPVLDELEGEPYEDEYITLNRRKRTCSVQGTPVALTRIEWDLTAVFLEHKGDALSATYLITKVWGPAYYDQLDLVKWHVSNIRRKLRIAAGVDGDIALQDATPIKTVRDYGYRWVE